MTVSSRNSLSPSSIARAFARLAVGMTLSVFLCGAGEKAADSDSLSEQEFRKNLTVLLERTEKSIEILRSQILENQAAPFLADLYLQLGELLTQKASTLYYIQMEREGRTGDLALSKGQFSPITEAQKEAIETFTRILAEFPRFDKRVKVFYLLAVSLKSIDEVPRFLKTAEKMMKQFPKDPQTMRVRLLLGQHYFDKGLYREALGALTPVLSSPFSYEKNLARYRVGLVYLAEERPKEALKSLELVITDKEFKDEDAPAEVSLKAKRVKSNLRREALIDSIRAFTAVYQDGGDPLGYYSRIAPNEILFYEVVEKLAFRLVSIKKYDRAISLLRTLSEMTIDPQKVINTYKDVLLVIPLEKRATIPPRELRYVLAKYSEWTNYYELPTPVLDDSRAFFEKQIRDLATRNHEIAKAQKDKKKRRRELKRARDYYLTYLAYFRETPQALKMAMNLADVYFRAGRYLEASDLYLRASLDEFGKPPDKEEIIKSAIVSAQKESDYSFYEQLRVRGILVKSIYSYLDISPKMAKDPQLVFLLLKTRYEQGYYKDTLPRLLSFIKYFPNSRQAIAAGELVLDYYNTRKDLEGLADASKRMLAMPLPKAFRDKVERIAQQSTVKQLDERIKAAGNFDPFEQGKSYLSSALKLGDEKLRNVALQQALARSKAERDIDTFFKSAAILAKKERDPRKRFEIQSSMAKEYVRVTRFYEAARLLESLAGSPGATTEERSTALGEAVEVALLLKDWSLLGRLARNRLWARLPATVKARLRDQVVDGLESGVAVPGELAERALATDLDDASLLGLFKAQRRLPGSLRSRLAKEVRSRCGTSGEAAVCRWARLAQLERQRERLVPGLDRAPASVQSIEVNARRIASLTEQYDALGGSGDAQLEIALSLYQSEVYRALAGYLKRSASANAELKDVLLKKADESLESAEGLVSRCREIVKKSPIVTPAHAPCLKGDAVPLEQMLQWNREGGGSFKTSDALDGDSVKLQRQVFSDSKEPDRLLDLAESYLERGYVHHAVATGNIGLSQYPAEEESFRALIGCGLVRLGLLNEAGFHLKKAGPYKGLTEKCRRQLLGS